MRVSTLTGTSMVSIPLWFSLNVSIRIDPELYKEFPSHYGSRSTKNEQVIARVLPEVSIPLWFSLNPLLKASLQFAHFRFHPTMVLAQLEAALYFLPKSTSFHPTMVLAQRRMWDMWRRWFDVSIPLWFSLNYLGSSPRTTCHHSFHPTMVLAQQPLLQKLYRITGGKVKSLLNPAQRSR